MTQKGEMKENIFPKWEGIARKALGTPEGSQCSCTSGRDGGHVPPTPCSPTAFCKNHVILMAYRRLTWVFSDRQVGGRNFLQQWSWMNSIDIDSHGERAKVAVLSRSPKAACDPQIITNYRSNSQRQNQENAQICFPLYKYLGKDYKTPVLCTNMGTVNEQDPTRSFQNRPHLCPLPVFCL